MDRSLYGANGGWGGRVVETGSEAARSDESPNIQSILSLRRWFIHHGKCGISTGFAMKAFKLRPLSRFVMD